MPFEAPNIDPRTATRIEADLREELRALRKNDPSFEPGAGLSGAMIGTFSRLAEIVIRRLNDVPRKNMLAFLDMLGAALLPPQSARVPLTFTLAAGGTTDAVVPPGTQVAAVPAEGEKTPVIYETERELVVTAALLDSAFAHQPEQDRYADLSRLLGDSVPSGAPVFAGDRRIEHMLYVGHAEYFALPSIKEVRLTFTLKSGGGPDPCIVRWEVWDGNRYVMVSATDGTNGFTTNGDVVLNAPLITANTPFPLTEVGGVVSRWLRCRLLTPITPSAAPVNTMVRDTNLPTVSNVKVSVTVGSNRAGLSPDAAFFNESPLDTSKDFLPFGASPGYNDTFYIADNEALSKPRATVTLTFNSTDADAAGIPKPKASDALKLRWEYWNGAKWAELVTVDSKGAATKDADRVAVPADQFKDTTAALTARSGTVTFRLPADADATTVNGVENSWVRARIVAGNYGDPPAYEPVVVDNVIKGYKPVAGTLAPPSLASVGVDFSLTTAADSEKTALVAYNDFRFDAVTKNAAFKPFRATADREPTLYLGFSLPKSRPAFPNRKLSLYAETSVFKQGERYGNIWPPVSRKSGKPGSVVTHEFWIGGDPKAPYVPSSYGSSWSTEARIDLPPGTDAWRLFSIEARIPADAPTGASDRGFVRVNKSGDPWVEFGASFETVASGDWAARRAQLSWEYWNGADWAALVARDGTRGFMTPGLIEFIAPDDFAAHEEFGLERFWLRVRWKSGGYSFAPHLSRLLLNTMTATQSVTVRDEMLGSSDASANQRFRATRAPVLPGERLEVREREALSDAESQKIRSEEGDDAVTVLKDSAGLVKEVWVRWHGVPDFYSSGPRDRHYVLDRLTGEVRFGDGLSGLIPPARAGNLRLRRYQTGGGVAGNRPAGVITQMKTTVPYIDKVINFVPAAGGADAEDLSSLIDRAPRTLRHGNRAVTIEDYEDLASLATPEVARVKCVPLYDLTTDPDATRQRLGVVSLVIVPRTSEAKPVPSIELLDRVREYLDAHRSPNAELYVVAPDYVRVDIQVTLGVKSLEGAREVESAVSRSLSQFLHPLTGGFDGKGWDFGRSVQKSDLYALLEETAGVDHVIALSYLQTIERGKDTSTDRALVYSGAHRISLTLEEA